MNQRESPTTVPPALVASLADRYRFDREVGSGGMATVYAAQDLKHDREVAIKVLRPELAAAVGPERFQREIAIAARLQHPHILPLLDSGVASGFLYYVMPFVRGESLRERLAREGSLSVAAAARILLDVSDALRYAHDQGIVHRDIKPENIMLSGRHAVVMDFGVARAVGRDPGAGTLRSTTIGVALGTPAYMAPEQAAADPNIDHRADLYALGVVGYEMLVGRPPFTADTPQQVLAAHVTEPPQPIHDLRPELPAGLAQVLMRCLAKRPAERWADADQLFRALEPYAATSSDALTPVATPPLVAFRRRAGAAGLAVVALALAAVAIGIGRRPATLVATGSTHFTVDPGLELDPALSPDGALVSYTTGPMTRMRVYVRQTDGGNPVPVAPDLLLSQRWPRWAPDARRVAFQAGGSIWIAPALGGQPERLVEGNDARPAGSVAWSPDGDRIAYTQDGEIRIRAVTGGDPESLVTDPDAHSLAWSPDGALLAYVSGNVDFVFGTGQFGNVATAVTRVVPVAGGPPADITDPNLMSMSPAWLPNGKELLVVSTAGGGRDVYRVRLARGRRGAAGGSERLTTGIDAHSVTISRDGKRVAVSSFSLTANVWSASILRTGTTSTQLAEQVTSGNQVVEDLHVPLGGTDLLFDANRGSGQDIYRLDLTTGSTTRITTDPLDDFGPVWSPATREIAFYRLQDGVRRIMVMEADGRNARPVTHGEFQTNQPQWSPDGRHLVFDGADSLRQRFSYVVSRRPDSTWTTPQRLVQLPARGVTWSPDGRTLALVDSASRLLILDFATRTTRELLSADDLGGGTLSRSEWLAKDTLLVRQNLPGGGGGIWRVPVGGAPQPVLWFDPARPSFREDYTTDGKRIFFVVSELESDLWLLTLSRR